MVDEFEALSPEEMEAVNDALCRIMKERLHDHFVRKTLPSHLLEFLKKKESEADASNDA